MNLRSLLLALAAASALLGQQPRPPVRFEISFPASARAEPVAGRVYVMITRSGQRAPRLQLNQVDGIPFFGRDVFREADFPNPALSPAVGRTCQCEGMARKLADRRDGQSESLS